jgi:hypothetical protein
VVPVALALVEKTLEFLSEGGEADGGNKFSKALHTVTFSFKHTRALTFQTVCNVCNV